MGRTLKDIKSQITSTFVNNEFIIEAYGLTEGKTFQEEFSLVSFENVLFDILAYSIFLMELLFVQHEKEVHENLENQKSGRLQWYRTMALNFQYGFDLLSEQDYFNNTGASLDVIENSKIIKYAAVNEGSEKGVVVVKIAGETNKVLAPITEDQKQSVVAYFEEIKWAGTYVNVINFLPDRLYLNLQIYRDALVLDAQGNSMKNGGKPVETAISEFMKELPFNGELVLQSLVDKLQLVEGVKIAHILQVQSSWIDTDLDDYGTPTQIMVKRIPVSGYYEIVNFDTITYVV